MMAGRPDFVFGSSLSSARAAAARCIGVICAETSASPAVIKAASSAKPRPATKSGMKSNKDEIGDSRKQHAAHAHGCGWIERAVIPRDNVLHEWELAGKAPNP